MPLHLETGTWRPVLPESVEQGESGGCGYEPLRDRPAPEKQGHGRERTRGPGRWLCHTSTKVQIQYGRWEAFAECD